MLNKFITESVLSMETNRFTVDPNISIVPDEWIRQDPASWTPSWKKAGQASRR